MADTAEPPGQPDPGLTREQIAILRAIRSLTRGHDGRPPSMREVATALDRKSAGGLAYQYRILEASGYLRRDPGSVRTVQVRLPGEPAFPAQPGGAAPLPAPGPEATDTPAGPGRDTVAWVPIAGQVAAGVPISPTEPPE